MSVTTCEPLAVPQVATTQAPSAPPTLDPPSIGYKPALILSLAFFPLVILGVMGWTQRWVTDDAFINFRIVANVLAGHGPVFNIGERVEAGTSSLWIALLSLAELAPLPFTIEMASVVVGLILSVLAVGIAQLGAKCAWPKWQGALSLPLGAVVFVALPPVWDFATSGLETGLSFFWIASAWAVTVMIARKPRPSSKWIVAGGCLISLATTVRPDFAIFGAAFSLVLVTRIVRQERRSLLLSVVALTAIPAAVQIARMGFFAVMVPNTAIAKSAGEQRIHSGLYYLVDFIDPYVLVLPFTLAAVLLYLRFKVGAPSSNRMVQLAQWSPVAAAVVHTSYLVWVGGDFMHGRLLLPSLFAALLPIMSITVKGRSVAIAVAIMAWATVCALFLRAPYATFDQIGFMANERAIWLADARTERPSIDNLVYARDFPTQTRDALPVNAPSAAGSLYERPKDKGLRLSSAAATDERSYLAVSTLGVVGFNADPSVWVVDRLGLADPIAARTELKPDSRPGHGKYLSQPWVQARFGADDLTNDPQVLAADQALECGQLAALIEAIEAPMTWDRFVQNVKIAAPLTKLHIPNDPLLARAQFCGPAQPQ